VQPRNFATSATETHAQGPERRRSRIGAAARHLITGRNGPERRTQERRRRAPRSGARKGPRPSGHRPVGTRARAPAGGRAVTTRQRRTRAVARRTAMHSVSARAVKSQTARQVSARIQCQGNTACRAVVNVCEARAAPFLGCPPSARFARRSPPKSVLAACGRCARPGGTDVSLRCRRDRGSAPPPASCSCAALRLAGVRAASADRPSDARGRARHQTRRPAVSVSGECSTSPGLRGSRPM